MPIENAKPWWQSKTMWGGIIAGAAGLGGLFGLSLDAGTQAELTDIAAAVAASVGGLLAIYGRIKADRKVG
jgi:outer membrane lipoprotein SlyB